MVVNWETIKIRTCFLDPHWSLTLLGNWPQGLKPLLRLHSFQCRNWRWITGDFHKYIWFVAQILTSASCYVSVENHIMPWISGIFANSNWKCNMIYWWESQAGHHATHMHQIPFPPLTWESNMRMATEVLQFGMCKCLWDAVINSLFGRTSTYEQSQEILTVKVHEYLLHSEGLN